MTTRWVLWMLVAAALGTVTPAVAAEPGEGEAGTVVTIWPLLDYRTSPREGFSNLSILGPLFKYQRKESDSVLAFRPLFHRTVDTRNDTVSSDYLYPLASSVSSPDETSVRALQLFQKHVYSKDEGANSDERTMLFPFYISGKSEKHGRYVSLFPFYGDIYGRFWRDEHHFLLFPLYLRTVKNGTTTTNYLYPFFSTVSGERESGFQFWPLYGQSAKENVYNSRFVLWPFYTEEESGLDTDAPVRKRLFFPLYGTSDGPTQTARTYLWPFFGYRSDISKQEEERDYLWPLWVTTRSPERTMTRWMPFYSNDINKGNGLAKTWYMWPLYRRDSIDSSFFRQERDRVLYFLYSDNREHWPKDGGERRRIALWPLFLYNRDVRGVSSLSLPAPVEPVLDKEGIEKSWAPLWRVYQQRWNETGDSAVSLLWNLYWHEVRGEDMAFELFPLVSYRKEKRTADVSLIKGLIRYRGGASGRSISLLWLPFGLGWGGNEGVPSGDTPGEPRS